MVKYLRLVVFIFFLASKHSFSQVVINEYSCSNRDLITDQDGDHPDYIELYNTSSSTVNLSGWYLTNDYNNLTQWTFPSNINIASHSFLLVYASEKDEVVGSY